MPFQEGSMKFIKQDDLTYLRVDGYPPLPWTVRDLGNGDKPYQFRVGDRVLAAYTTQAEAEEVLAKAVGVFGDVVHEL